MKVHRSVLTGAIRRNPAAYQYRHIPSDRATKTFAESVKHKRAMSSTGAPSSSSSPPPSQVKGHVVWIKGAVNEMVGRMSGSESWTNSGRADQAHAIEEMRAAKTEGDAKLGLDKRGPGMLQAEGKMEGMAGMMVGCQGMKERGAVKCETGKRKKSS
ncbi:uncharacterized protein H6S33_005696 [Morchella sextelata]|uniref:uncharacterized protein n=1 Tax=Morchella sextelata TaxID=1174677 RepID=UPI001D04C188|nr:uncharacterized protein H6S33_005696 [Morchella sextelata]KAH0613810.1 hypothetical protein H6S33_005696 [Morchella sextelata]